MEAGHSSDVEKAAQNYLTYVGNKLFGFLFIFSIGQTVHDDFDYFLIRPCTFDRLLFIRFIPQRCVSKFSFPRRQSNVGVFWRDVKRRLIYSSVMTSRTSSHIRVMTSYALFL